MAIFNILLIMMSVLAFIVFVVLYFVEAGYGMLISPKWGWMVNNKFGWVVMESPVFITMTLLWWFSDRKFEPTILVIFLLFQSHSTTSFAGIGKRFRSNHNLRQL